MNIPPTSVGTTGWYQYTFDIPATFTSNTNYVLINGVSAYGNDIHLDDISVYAFAPKYTVTYNGNSSDGGATPTDASNPYLSGATVTLLANTFTKTGYGFAGWNTLANGSGTAYASGATFAIGSANVILYAQWKTPTLTVATSGSGTGTVTSTPAGISCSKTGSGAVTCESTFSGIVELFATPSILSKFGGWGSDCSGLGACSVSMTTNRSVTASFGLAALLHIGGTAYPTLQAAYDAATDGDVIQMLQSTESGVLTANRNITVKLFGGYDASYSTRPGRTKVGNPLKIKNGKLIVDRIVVK